MRVYRVDGGASFVEYAKQDFSEENFEATLQSWLTANPDAILEDSAVQMIGREVTTNLGTFIDLLGLDRDGDVVVIELKRNETPRTTLAQALEYASFAATLDFETLQDLFRSFMGDENMNLNEAHREYFNLGDDEAASFNKEQRVVIVGHDVTPQIRQTATFLRQKGLPVTCVEFTYFETATKEQLLTTDIVVGREPMGVPVTSAGSGEWLTESKLLAGAGIAAPALKALLGIAGKSSLYVRWSAKAFSLCVDVGGRRVPLIYAYVPGVWFSRAHHGLYTDAAMIRNNVRDGAKLVAELTARLQQDPLWEPSGTNMKCAVDHEFSAEEVARLVSYVEDARAAVVERGPIASDEDTDDA